MPVATQADQNLVATITNSRSQRKGWHIVHPSSDGTLHFCLVRQSSKFSDRLWYGTPRLLDRNPFRKRNSKSNMRILISCNSFRSNDFFNHDAINSFGSRPFQSLMTPIAPEETSPCTAVTTTITSTTQSRWATPIPSDQRCGQSATN